MNTNLKLTLARLALTAFLTFGFAFTLPHAQAQSEAEVLEAEIARLEQAAPSPDALSGEWEGTFGGADHKGRIRVFITDVDARGAVSGYWEAVASSGYESGGTLEGDVEGNLLNLRVNWTGYECYFRLIAHQTADALVGNAISNCEGNRGSTWRLNKR